MLDLFVKYLVPLIVDTVPLACSILSVYFVAKQATKIGQQTVFSIQIETLNGIYMCMSVIESKPHWPASLSDMDEKNIDNFKSAPHELKLLNAWLSNLRTQGIECGVTQDLGSPITVSFTTKLWFQTKCLWPANHTSEALSFLSNYRDIQGDINRMINGYGIDHPGANIEAIYEKVQRVLLPSYMKLVNSDCLNQMENDTIKNLQHNSPIQKICSITKKGGKQ